MSDTREVQITCAAVSDRGLNEKRPLNEDSFLADEKRRIFVVCDGVGGAEAGEVASQTAVEVLDEAFRHQRDGDDVEDLLEIAIQRANTSIHQMSREHPRLSMMATTVVALHLDGHRATVGHVGDSRLYRLTPGGEILRETIDHSVVEEEVQAGRMTPQQAANHPSRNVISRALGAEPAVEVDLKALDVEDGTTFLLCSDGITRHVTDEEIAAVLRGADGLEAACEELKRRCFERGAEDNLTAVLVRVGERPARGAQPDGREDEEHTLISPQPANSFSLDAANAPTAELNPAAATHPASHLRRPFNDVGAPAPGARANSKLIVPAEESTAKDSPPPTKARPDSQARRDSSGGGFVRALGLLLLVAGVGAVAFYGGLMYQRHLASGAAGAGTDGVGAARPAQSTLAGGDGYEQRRRAVDLAPAAEVERRTREMNGQPLDSRNPEFLYLYGRALLLSDRPREAAEAFAQAVARAEEDMTPENAQLKVEARIGRMAALLRAGEAQSAQAAARELDDVVRQQPGNEVPLGVTQTPANSPLP